MTDIKPKVGMRVLIKDGPWSGHTGVIKETDVRGLFVRIDLGNGIESLTVPRLCQVVATPSGGTDA